MNVLVSGGAGFIGANLVNHIVQNTDWRVVCVDKLSYASKAWDRLKQFGSYYSPKLTCITWDLQSPFSDGVRKELGDINVIIHMAAETHVDTSISDPVGTIHNNVMSTVYLLEYARTLKNLQKFYYFSTDETYGNAPHGVSYKETDRHNPSNPYSASKAASENICVSYKNTYGIPLITSNLTNAFSIMQHVEKFIPLVIKKLLNDEEVSIHAEQDMITPGSRYYVHTSSIVSAIMFILEHAQVGSTINIAGITEVTNLEVAQKIAALMNKPLKYKLTRCPPNRPGHDTRYSLDGSKLTEMGWKDSVNFDEELEAVVNWTLKHPEWLQE